MHENTESLHVLQLVATSLGIVHLAADISVAITVEVILFSDLTLEVNLDVDFLHWLASRVAYFQLAKSLKHCYLELVLVEGVELLKITTVNLNY